MRLDPHIVQQQITGLLLQFPELAEDDQLRADMIEGETDANEFLRMIERRRQEAVTLAAALAENIKELGIRKGRFERREEAMRELTFKIMQTADLKKIELPEASLSIRRVPPRVIITDEESLPDIACKFIRKPDLTKIKELLTDSTGCCAGAEMSNGSETLSIRTK